MPPKLRLHHPGHGTVVAYIALFVALGGTSYGVATGSINSREIKNNNVRGKDIRRATVKGSDVAANTVKGADIAESTLSEVPSAASAGLLDGVDSSVFVQGPLLASAGGEGGASLNTGAPNLFFTGTEFQNPSPRRFAVWVTKTLTYSCIANGPCSADLGLYANDTPLDGSGRAFSDAVGGGVQTQQLVMLGLTPVLPAGNVEIRIARSDSTGTASFNASQPGQIVAVALDG